MDQLKQYTSSKLRHRLFKDERRKQAIKDSGLVVFQTPLLDSELPLSNRLSMLDLPIIQFSSTGSFAPCGQLKDFIKPNYPSPPSLDLVPVAGVYDSRNHLVIFGKARLWEACSAEQAMQWLRQNDACFDWSEIKGEHCSLADRVSSSGQSVSYGLMLSGLMITGPAEMSLVYDNKPGRNFDTDKVWCSGTDVWVGGHIIEVPLV